MPRLVGALVTVLFFVALPATAHVEDIFLATLSFPAEIAEWYEREFGRVEKLCGQQPGACWSRELQHKTWMLNPVHSSPDDNAPKQGAVVAASSAPHGWLGLRFEYHPSNGSPAVWLDSQEIGDWGYGIHVVAIAKGEPSQGDHPVWVRLSGVPGPAWVKLPPHSSQTPAGLTGELESITSRIFEVEPGILATNRRTGSQVRLPARVHYVAEKVTGGQVFLRREVGADMPCGGKSESDRPTTTTARYRVPVRSLFKENGKPRLRLAYPKGC